MTSQGKTAAPEREGYASKEFAPREVFLGEFSNFIETLNLSEEVLSNADQGQKRQFTELVRGQLTDFHTQFSPDEIGLFEKTFNLFSIKYSLPPFDNFPEFCEIMMGEGKQEFVLEAAGVVGVGKSTLTEFVSPEIKAKMESERFHSSENPFLSLAYSDNDYWLRTELGFGLDSIFTGLRGKLYDGRWARDTSVWSDNFIFMRARVEGGQVTDEEYKVYKKTVELLKPLISKPDLLVLMLPTSVERLYQGLQERIEGNPKVRDMERKITLEDLEVMVRVEREAIEPLREEGIKVLPIVVDPPEFYRNPDLKYATLFSIRDQLEILGEYLKQDPKEVADYIVSRIFSPNMGPQVVIAHSKSMFAGKTSVLTYISEMVGDENILAFQPAAALRYGPEYETKLKNRDGVEIPANTIWSNKLSEILEDVKRRIGSDNIDPRKTYLFIDETMLFYESDADEAVSSVEELRQMGFHVVCDFIDYTFQEEPFNFAHKLIREATVRPDWHEVELGTTCKYCDNEAQGTRRYNQYGEIADYDDKTFVAGEEQYEPVCCKNGHISCVNQQEDFVRQPLPSLM